MAFPWMGAELCLQPKESKLVFSVVQTGLTVLQGTMLHYRYLICVVLCRLWLCIGKGQRWKKEI